MGPDTWHVDEVMLANMFSSGLEGEESYIKQCILDAAFPQRNWIHELFDWPGFVDFFGIDASLDRFYSCMDVVVLEVPSV